MTEALLAGLVYTKIGRSDIPDTRPGDRRFTFAHRRYQETLFVKYLVAHPTHLSPSELLTNARWREYAVTLLQTQAPSVVMPLVDEATALLRSFDSRSKVTTVLPEYGGALTYFRWNEELLILLRLLDEGLAARDDVHDARFSEACRDLLMPRWNDGDFDDRMNVLRVAGLLPQGDMGMVLQEAVSRGTAPMLDVAFRKSAHLRVIPENFAPWLRTRLADEVLECTSETEVLRLDALASRLDRAFAADLIVKRCTSLRRQTLAVALMSAAVVLVLRFGSAYIRRRKPLFEASAALRVYSSLFGVNIVGLTIAYECLVVLAITAQLLDPGTHSLGFVPRLCVVTLALGYISRSVVLFLLRDVPASIGLSSLFAGHFWTNGRAWLTFAGVAVFVTLVLIISSIGQSVIGLNLGSTKSVVAVGSIATVGMLLLFLVDYWTRKTAIRHLKRWQRDQCPLALALHASSLQQLRWWLYACPEKVLSSPAAVRSLSRVLVNESWAKLTHLCTHRPKALFLDKDAALNYGVVSSILRLARLASSKDSGPGTHV